MSIQLGSRTSSWLYVAGGAAVGLVAWGAVARRKRQRLTHPNTGVRARSAQASHARHRALVGGASQLPPSVQTLVGGLSQPASAAETPENGPLHERKAVSL